MAAPKKTNYSPLEQHQNLKSEIKVILTSSEQETARLKREEGAELEKIQSDFNASQKTQLKKVSAQIANQIVNEGIDIAEFHINREFNLTDNYIAQRDYSIATQMVSQAANKVASIASWTATGAQIGGPWGAVAGFAIGSGFAIFDTVKGNIQADRIQRDMINIREASLDFTRSRAGWSTKAGSIGEDL